MTLHDREPALRRLCLAVDMERYSSNPGGEEQARAQAALAKILDAGAADSDVDRMLWTRQPAGDGELALLPPGIDEPEFVARFVRGVKSALYRHNHAEQPRVRLRLALDAGLVWPAAQGYAGTVVVDVSRLCDARPVRDRLRDDPDHDLVLVVSSCLYRDIQGYRYHDLPPESFTMTRIDNPEKGFSAVAWIHTGADGRPAGAASAASAASDRQDAPSGDGGSAPPPGIHGAGAVTVVHGDQRNVGRDAFEARRDIVFGGRRDEDES